MFFRLEWENEEREIAGKHILAQSVLFGDGQCIFVLIKHYLIGIKLLSNFGLKQVK